MLCSIHHARGHEINDPGRFVTRAVFSINGKPAAVLDYGPNTAKNPQVGIHLKSLREDDMIEVEWLDSAGRSGRLRGAVFELEERET